MKTHLWTLVSLFACQWGAVAQSILPPSAPGRFAPVPPPITQGPDTPATPMEPTPPALGNCKNAASVLKKLGIRLTADQSAQLDAQRFLLVPIESTSLGEALPVTEDDKQWAFTSDEMLEAFSRLGGDFAPTSRQADNTRLVTPDLVLHAWHRGFSRTLEYIEQRRLHEVLNGFLSGTLENARALRAAATGPAKERLAWTEARFAAAWILLGPPSPADLQPQVSDDSNNAPAAKAKAPAPSYEESIALRLTAARKKLPPDVGDLLAKEITLVLAAAGMEKSPLFPNAAKPADYSQFTPRSHYTKNPTLGGYFRAMMFLGRNAYDLQTPEAISDATLAALAMAKSPAKGKSPLAHWQDLMEITGFFVGQSDDITYTEFRAWMVSVLGTTGLDPNAAMAPELTAKLAARLSDLRPPRIVSSAHADATSSPVSDPPSFRICGQRFSWDARVLDRLTRGAPNEMPSTPAAVMIAAAFGCAYAEKISQQLVSNNPRHAEQFAKRLPEIRKELATVNDEAWFESMAAKQLHVISTLARARHANFPAFMTHEAFRAKNIDSMLGSFTELKHDTVLYAKQVYAEAGEGGLNEKLPPLVKGFVQPDVPFWREMERLAIFAADGFARHHLLPDADEPFSRFRTFAKDMGTFRKLAEKHVAGTPLTATDWEKIRTINLSYIAAPLVQFDEPKPGDGKCALVTDILTDATAGTILCEALGRPYVMMALIGGKDGNRMVTGLAYNHFEFSRPLNDGRLTDEQWQTTIYQPNPKLPAKAPWQTKAVRPSTLPPPKQ